MNKVFHSFLFLLTGVLCASCIEINGSGYSDLTETEKQHVKKCISDIGALQNDGNLYQITAEQAKEYIKKEQNVLVYEYLPFCSGESGRSPMEVKAYCDEKELKCLVISSVYDGIFPIPTTNTFPMLVIDHQVYGTDNYQEYSNQFYQQLTGSNEDSRMESSFHLFSNGKYVRSIVSLMDLCKMSDLKEVAEDVAQEQEDNVLSVLEKKRVIEESRKVDRDIISKFESLVVDWKNEISTNSETMFSSSTLDYKKLPQFKSLREMGSAIIPLVMEKLLNDENFFMLPLYDELQLDSTLKVTHGKNDRCCSEGEQNRARRTVRLWINSL